MLSQGAKLFSDIPITVFGMFIFLLVFTAVTIWTFFRPQSKDFYKKIENLPFSGDQNNE